VLGEAPGDLLSKISDLIEILAGERPGFANVDSAAAKLSEALGDRRILMIVDDVWREQDLRPFLQGGPRTTRLITTRLTRVLPASIALRQPVDAMTGQEARELLSRGLPADQALAHSKELSDLARRLGEWAQLLKLVNGFLRERVIDSREPLRDALVDAAERLTEQGLTIFDADDQDDRTKAVARTINLSLSLLDTGQRARFAELAVFPEDADIPTAIVARLWQETASLSEGRTKDLLVKLYGLSLLLGLDLNQRTLRFHDTTRRFLQDQAGREGLVAQHKQLLKALDEIRRSPEAADAPSRRYFYLHFPHHLAEAEERERLDELLLDPGWLKAKLEATGNPQALIADYEQYAVGQVQNLIGRTLRLTVGICARDPRQLIPQLLGRLMACEDIAARHFLDAARRHLGRPAILTQRPSLTTPGAQTARLEGHTDGVNALCVLADRRLASGSGDQTIRLWDVSMGAETVHLDGNTNSVTARFVLPDGRLASGSRDETIRLWDVKTGTETARLDGHMHWVNALCMLPDGRLTSGSGDRTIRLWDVKTGAETARLDGHADSVTALCVLPDGRLASGCDDRTIRLWDVKTGAETARLDGHTHSVGALCVLPDGRLASGSRDKTIRLWDLKTGVETARLDGHPDWVSALCVLPDEQLASGSLDKTIRLWEVKTGAETARLDRHTDSVNALCMLPRRLASGSHDNTIRLWDVKTGVQTTRLDGHTAPVSALRVLSDGRLASGSWDKTIRLWDLKTGEETACLEGHWDSITALCVLPDGRLASGSGDSTIWLWDVKTEDETARLEGHPGYVSALCVLPDGRLASGSGDSTILLWDVETDDEIARLDGHTDSVTALCVLPDGRLATGSHDCTIRLWDVETGAETARLDGHTDSVTALCVLSDGRLASGSHDNTIRLWDVKTGAETARLEVDAALNSVAALPDGRVVAGDELGFVHWLEIVD
jgi:WD40 repeat protein